MSSRIETPKIVFQGDDSVMKNSAGKHYFTTVVAAGQTSIDLVPADTTLFPDGKIPDWATEIVLSLDGVSVSGTSMMLVRLGGAALLTSGYLSTSSSVATGSTGTSTNATGFHFQSASGANALSGDVVLRKSHSTNTWRASAVIQIDSVVQNIILSGRLTLSEVLKLIRLTTVNGTDTFDAGTIGGYFR